MEIPEKEWEEVKNRLADLEKKVQGQWEVILLLRTETEQNGDSFKDIVREMEKVAKKVFLFSKAVQKSFDEIIVENHP